MPMPNVAVPLARKVPMLTKDMSESHHRVDPLPVLQVNHVSKLPEKMPVLPPISAMMMKPIKVAIHCSRVILMFFTQPIRSFVCFGGVGLSTHFFIVISLIRSRHAATLHVRRVSRYASRTQS